MTHQVTFAEFGLNPACNIFPEGSLTLGAPSKTKAIPFPSDTGEVIPFSEKVHMIIQFVNECVAANMIKPKAGALLIFFIPQKGGCTAATNNSGGLLDPDTWDIMESKDEYTDGSPLLKAIAELNDAQNIGVFIETDDGSLQPIANTDETDLSAWLDKEFEV